MSKFEDLTAEEKQAAQDEFENKDTTRERRIELLEMVREGADEAEMGVRCPRCRHYPFFAPHDEALIEGHVYSHDGVAEIRITGYCEFCFDLITEEPEEEDEDAWKQRAIAQDMDAMAQAMGPNTEVRLLSPDEVLALFTGKDESHWSESPDLETGDK
jgi:hypothetical protein